MVLPKYRTVIFVHSCFCHEHKILSEVTTVLLSLSNTHS
ncbi:hypothetical protein FW778_09010 [Ginsengibacter hankyongi]|uniref:Uncharacterized protein n=1 Tax=Ginsengibacter hankyongi TaxID=2607284 RepID=A0A5J5IML2_9BACT|nr:hypothetical protein FW778_09010 [Ginsengibacter hankyongi]